MKKCVVDSSFVLSYLFADERRIEVDDVFTRYENGEINLIAPSLIPFEIANGLRSAVLRKRISSRHAVQLLRVFLQLGIETVEQSIEAVLAYAMKHNTSAYDAPYALLAKVHKLQLFTLDKHLLKLTQT